MWEPADCEGTQENLSPLRGFSGLRASSVKTVPKNYTKNFHSSQVRNENEPNLENGHRLSHAETVTQVPRIAQGSQELEKLH